MDIVRPPQIKDGDVTEGFRIGDLKSSSIKFLDDLSKYFDTVIPQGVQSPPRATDLRLQTLEEAIQISNRIHDDRRVAFVEEEEGEEEEGEVLFGREQQQQPQQQQPSPPQNEAEEQEEEKEEEQEEEYHPAPTTKTRTTSPSSTEQDPNSTTDGAKRIRKLTEKAQELANYAASLPPLPPKLSKKPPQQSKPYPWFTRYTVDEKRTAIEVHTEAVTLAKQKYEKERATAALHLNSLRSLPSRTIVSDKNRNMMQLISHTGGTVNAVNGVHAAAATNTAAHTSDRGHGVALNHQQEPGSSNGSALRASPAPVPPGELVVRIALYLPQTPAHIQQEWLVLGSQKLIELRDAFDCLNERNMRAVEEDAKGRGGQQQQQLPLSSCHPLSSYIYLDGTFYVDTRNKGKPGFLEYSGEIRTYLAQHNIPAPLHPPPGPHTSPLGPFTNTYSVTPMEHRVFDDLWVRIGPGGAGLYCHIGGCEHLLVVQDVRQYHPDVDPKYVHEYPFRLPKLGRNVSRPRLCEACGVFLAKKITHRDRAAPHTPFVWCEACYKDMHFDGEGNVLYDDFEVYPYIEGYQPAILKTEEGGGRDKEKEREKDGEEGRSTKRKWGRPFAMAEEEQRQLQQ